jgi:hypothetical protein
VQRAAFDEFTQELRRRLEPDPRVLGLVALGSMSGEPPEPDEWSDHDFFVVTRPGEQERMRNELSWLPRAHEIVLAFRETPHGVKALYRDAHLLEFAVFDLDELGLARVNRYRVLFDRADIESRMGALRDRTARELRPPEARWLQGQFITGLLIAANRDRRGERMSARARLQSAAGDLVQLARQLLPARSGSVPDSLDPLRRVEAAWPRFAASLDEALTLPPPAAALRMLALACELPGFPAEAAEVLYRHLGAL